MIVAAVYARHSFEYTLFTFSTNRTSTYLGWPKGIWTASILFMFVLMTLYFALEIFRGLRPEREDADVMR